MYLHGAEKGMPSKTGIVGKVSKDLPTWKRPPCDRQTCRFLDWLVGQTHHLLFDPACQRRYRQAPAGARRRQADCSKRRTQPDQRMHAPLLGQGERQGWRHTGLAHLSPSPQVKTTLDVTCTFQLRVSNADFQWTLKHTHKFAWLFVMLMTIVVVEEVELLSST
ncbi:hypothetical protein BD289DRAFT_152552 [Coniella lustricola]|uniref:Uncharacterized protein n=1 Tax=Coniella lustricola TaxID=2025994 RepID=A0A2T2ZUN7_9PEZI|nr:hypothetical protein BD289DRAFT_152552 [Coniella lustricola]